MLTSLLVACQGYGLTQFEGAGAGTDGHGGLDEPARGDPPALNTLDPWRNEDVVTLTGLAAPGDEEVVVRVSTSAGTTSVTVEVLDDAFTTEVELVRGEENEITAENDHGTSQPVSTTACDPYDVYAVDAALEGLGRVCEASVEPHDRLPDNQASVQITGNVLVADEVDWFTIYAVDEPVVENSASYENFHLEVELLEGVEAYRFRVIPGGCNGTPECPSLDGYDHYEDFASDTEPDEEGNVPADPRACGDAPFNACEDWSKPYFIEVRRVDGLVDCTHYTLEIRNGFW